MSQDRLRTAVLGLGAKGQQLLEIAGQTGLFDIVAVADADLELAEKVALRYKAEAFDDYRQLVIQNQINLLLVAEPAYVCGEHIRKAMKKKCNVLKLIPPALDFEQAAELVGTAKSQKVRFATANIHRFYPGFRKLKEYLESKHTKDINLITAVKNLPKDIQHPGRDRWLSDPQLAGGGVLLRNCYEIVDLIVGSFGIPQQVYCVNTNQAPDKQQRLSITEDTTVLTMKFSDTRVAGLVASRVFGPTRQMLQMHTENEYLTASEDNLTVWDNLGNVIERFQFESSETEATEEMLENFAHTLLGPDKNPIGSEENSILHNMAVVESAYLSARTTMPEEPAKILEMAKKALANI
ncbi:MAG TPA: Gfo/Idh/MocA family oxidoreductase [Planctomycetes bacterium]|nr:Gfo/Idh/MocA family oxidoreductase [Planctomycetota bacterium]HIJ71417.1 Gfo/Idh/MocA family oxidoreductase [Planctomycetota bacterium]